MCLISLALAGQLSSVTKAYATLMDRGFCVEGLLRAVETNPMGLGLLIVQLALPLFGVAWLIVHRRATGKKNP